MERVYLVQTKFPNISVWDVCTSEKGAKASLEFLKALNEDLDFEIYPTYTNCYNKE